MANKGTYDDDDPHQALARNVRRLRQKAGLTQQQLSKRARLAYTYVGRLETQTSNPRLGSIKRLANALGVTTVELLTPQPRRK